MKGHYVSLHSTNRELTQEYRKRSVNERELQRLLKLINRTTDLASRLRGIYMVYKNYNAPLIQGTMVEVLCLTFCCKLSF